jgi:hypothetical protein
MLAKIQSVGLVGLEANLIEIEVDIGVAARQTKTKEINSMCRNIKTLYNFAPPATDGEIHAAALQYVRKISGFAKPSAANAAAFHRAIIEVEEASSRLLSLLVRTCLQALGNYPQDETVSEGCRGRG